MIGGCSKVVQDVPPYMIADGNPAETRTINKVGLDRHGVSDDAQNALKQAYKILFRGLSIPNALTRIEQELPPLPEVQHLVQFVRASERGISKYGAGQSFVIRQNCRVRVQNQIVNCRGFHAQCQASQRDRTRAGLKNQLAVLPV